MNNPAEGGRGSKLLFNGDPATKTENPPKRLNGIPQDVFNHGGIDRT